ncbi:MAG: pyrroline-5-carboxylate reductase [Pseudomonadota bacterium]
MNILQFGCGNMGGAMLAGWLAGGISPQSVTLVDPFLPEPPAGVLLLREAPSGARPADVVVLGFKPQQLAEAAGAVGPHVGPGTLLLSILAGVDLATLRGLFPDAAGTVRVMPNLAAALGKSAIGLAGEVSDGARLLTEQLMAPLGHAEWLENEGQMDLVTALAGSGPAFVYRMIDALAGGAAALGLPREHADRLALSMVEGAAALAAASDHPPAELARRVASPGGTTQAGLDVLDAGGLFAALIQDTLRAARDRGAQMTEQARAGR